MKSEHHPLSPITIVSGLIVTVLGGVIVAWLIGEGSRFTGQTTQAVTSPSSTQVIQQVMVVVTATPPPQGTTVAPPLADISTPTQPPTQAEIPTSVTPTPTPTPVGNTLPNGEPVSPESLARSIGGNSAYWTKRGPVVWGYWDKGHNVTFHHPGGNTILTYWAGFSEPRNAEGCSIVIPSADNMTRYVKCPSGTRAEFESDGVGFHLVDYTGFFP